MASKFAFRGGGSVLEPNHITRYEYPRLLGHDKSDLVLQTPSYYKTRSRPQGRAHWDLTYITITPSGRDPPTRAQFKHWLLAESKTDNKSANPLGRAMRRVTAYQGNTLLEAGKFKIGGKLVFKVKRTTMVPLGGEDKGEHRKEEAMYEIPCEEWRAMRPPGSKDMHDCWWVRLQDLFWGYPDRAYFHAKNNMENMKNAKNQPDPVSQQLIEWVPRQDIIKSYNLTIHYKKQKFDSDSCIICGDTWYLESDYPATLKCKHMMCLECLVMTVDGNKPTDLYPGEKDPGSGVKFWRCPECKDINICKQLHHLNLRHDEIKYWRWYAAHLMLEKFTGPEWLTYLQKASGEGDHWIAPFEKPRPQDVAANRLDLTPPEDMAVTYVRFKEAVFFLHKAVLFIAGMQPWGYTLDKPHETMEAQALAKCLEDELMRLSMSKQKFNTRQLIDHMTKVGERAFQPVVVKDKEARLGNPIYPAGYESYRKFVCEWTARGCFWSEHTRADLMYCVDLMVKKPKAWWEGEPKFPPAP